MPLDPDLEAFWARLGFVVVQGYGLTDAGQRLLAHAEESVALLRDFLDSPDTAAERRRAA